MARNGTPNCLFLLRYPVMKRVLYQFPLSHYCEKARWLLDFKQLDYEVKNLVPATHRVFTLLKAQTTTVPLVKDGQEWIGDSTDLAFYLDAKYTLRPLLPSDPQLRTKVVMIEQQADKAGVHVRRYAYSQLLQTEEVINLLLGDSTLVRLFKKQLAGQVRQGITKLYKITPETGESSRLKMQQAINDFEQVLQQNGGRYLVGDCLSLADIAVASMFAPLLAIKDTPWQTLKPNNQSLQQVYDNLSQRPLGQWIMRLYQEQRQARGNWRG